MKKLDVSDISYDDLTLYYDEEVSYLLLRYKDNVLLNWEGGLITFTINSDKKLRMYNTFEALSDDNFKQGNIKQNKDCVMQCINNSRVDIYIGNYSNKDRILLDIDYDNIDYDDFDIGVNQSYKNEVRYKGETLLDDAIVPVKFQFFESDILHKDKGDDDKIQVKMTYYGMEKLSDDIVVDYNKYESVGDTLKRCYKKGVIQCMQGLRKDRFRFYHRNYEGFISVKSDKYEMLINYEELKDTRYKGWTREEIQEIYISSYRINLIPVFKYDSKSKAKSKLYLYEDKEEIDPMRLCKHVCSNAFGNSNTISHLFPAVLYKKWSLEKLKSNSYSVKGIQKVSNDVGFAINAIGATLNNS